MRQIIIKAKEIPDREVLHDILSEKLEVPEWYGRNLDALYDILTAELQEETEIRIETPEQLEDQLGTYGKVFLRVLEEASEENPKLRIR